MIQRLKTTIQRLKTMIQRLKTMIQQMKTDYGFRIGLTVKTEAADS